LLIKRAGAYAKTDGQPCQMAPLRDRPYCFSHDPERAEERIAALARGGHIDPKLLHTYNGGVCPVWWVVLAPFIRQLRAVNEDETEYNNFEWLAGVMAELDRRAGASAFDEALLVSQLPSRIASFQDRLRFERDLRSATVASPDPATVERPAPPSASPLPSAAAEQATSA
jgi:hypothetical protein